MTIEITAPSVVTHFKQPRGRKHIRSLDSYFVINTNYRYYYIKIYIICR